MLTYHFWLVKMMRILHLVHQYPPQHIGGTEFYTQWLTRELQRRGHTLAVFHRCSGEGTGIMRRTEDGIDVWSAWDGSMMPNGRFLSTFKNKALSNAFAHVLEQTKPDCVHIQHLMGLPAQLVHQIRAANIPYVVTLHDYYTFCANAQLITNDTNELCDGPNYWLNCAKCALVRAGKPPSNWLTPAIAPILAWRQKLLQPLLQYAQCTIAPSHFVRKMVAQAGLPVENMRVVVHGIQMPDTEMGIKLAEAAKRPFTPPLRIAYIGGISWQKGVHVLITAVNQLPQHNIQLTIYGDTMSFPEYVTELRTQIQHANITLAGRVDRSALWDALAQTDIVVISSLWYETSSLIIQEAFAANVPVIATNLGAMPEKVTHGVNGLLVPPGDAAALAKQLQAIAQHPEKLIQLRQGIEPVRTIRGHVDSIETIYRQAVLS